MPLSLLLLLASHYAAASTAPRPGIERTRSSRRALQTLRERSALAHHCASNARERAIDDSSSSGEFSNDLRLARTSHSGEVLEFADAHPAAGARSQSSAQSRRDAIVRVAFDTSHSGKIHSSALATRRRRRPRSRQRPAHPVTLTASGTRERVRLVAPALPPRLRAADLCFATTGVRSATRVSRSRLPRRRRRW